jgi:hypothetical protein
LYKTAAEQRGFSLFRHWLNRQKPRVSAKNGISLADHSVEKQREQRDRS